MLKGGEKNLLVNGLKQEFIFKSRQTNIDWLTEQSLLPSCLYLHYRIIFFPQYLILAYALHMNASSYHSHFHIFFLKKLFLHSFQHFFFAALCRNVATFVFIADKAPRYCLWIYFTTMTSFWLINCCYFLT